VWRGGGFPWAVRYHNCPVAVAAVPFPWPLPLLLFPLLGAAVAISVTNCRCLTAVFEPCTVPTPVLFGILSIHTPSLWNMLGVSIQ